MAMNRIRELIQGKTAYIVPGVYAKEDTILGIKLNVPLFSGNPEALKRLQKKSESKKLFEACNFPVAPGADQIYSEDDLYSKLTLLLIKFPLQTSWILKIDDEFNGRGTAVFSIENIKSITQLLADQPFPVENTEKLYDLIKTVIKKNTPRLLGGVRPSRERSPRPPRLSG